MGFRLRKSIKVLPGVKLNISNGGVSTTIGKRGASINVGKRGTHLNVGIPGSGVSYRTRIDQPGQRHTQPAPRMSWQLMAATMCMILGVIVLLVYVL